MSTHHRAWLVRAGVVIVVAAAGLFGVASPALAAEPTITITSLSSGTLQSGGQPATLKFTVKNNNNSDPTQADIQVTFTFGEISCQGSCDFTQAIAPNTTSPEFTATLQPGSVPAGQNRSGKVRITATIGGDTATVERDLQVQGPAQVQTVPEVSGIVVDVFTAKPVEAAKVFLQDSASPPHTYSIGTGKDGAFKFTSKPDAPIVPGILVLQVEKDGVQTYNKTVNASPGVPVRNQRLAVTPTSSPTPSPSAGESGSGSPVVSPIVDDPLAGGLNEGGGGLSWILIAIGGVLVLLGIGAIVLLFVRKREDDQPDHGGPRRGPHPPGPPGPPGRGGPRPPMPRRGPPERTTVMRGPGMDPRGRPPVSGGPRGADQTMIARSPLADVPTQLHNRVPADYADPTRPGGAPPPPGYGPHTYGAHGGYGQQPNYPGGAPAGYPGGASGYGQPDPYAGGPGPGYGGQPPYGQPGHEAPPGGYGQPDPYAQQGGYDPRAARPAQPPHTPHPEGRVDWLDD